MTWAELQQRQDEVTAHAAEHVLGWQRCTHDDPGCECGAEVYRLVRMWALDKARGCTFWEPFRHVDHDNDVLAHVKTWSGVDRELWGDTVRHLVYDAGCESPLILYYQPGMFAAAAALVRGFK